MNTFCLKILLGFALGCVLCGVVRTQDGQDVIPDNTTSPDYQLVLVQAIWRHGNRTPQVNFPVLLKDYINDTKPFEFGQLTPAGRRASLGMGQYFRKRYSSLFPPYFSYTAANAECTAIKRTQETSWVAMAGMWPPAGPQVWQNQGLGQLWTPIPCDYLPVLQDKVWLQVAACPRLIELLLATIETVKFKMNLLKLTDFGAVNQYIAFNEGLASVDDIQLAIIYDNFLSKVSNGEDLPHWATRVYPSPLREVYGSYVNVFCNNPESTKLTVGEFWRNAMKIAASLEADDLTPSDRVFYGYSVHDVNVACLMHSLKLVSDDEPLAPTFTASLIIEWYRDQSNASSIGAKFVYRTDTLGNTANLTIPGCADICPLDTIRTIIADLIPLNSRDEYCKPMNPLALAQYEVYEDIMRLWLSAESRAQQRKFMQSYLTTRQVDLR